MTETLLDSPFFQFALQSTAHSIIAALVAEVLLRAWRIAHPPFALFFRALPLLMPVALFPLFEFIYPAREGQAFREGLALLDLNRWMRLSPWGSFTLLHGTIFVMAATTAFFLAQELFPWLAEKLGPGGGLEPVDEGAHPALLRDLEDIASRYKIPPPPVHLIKIPAPVIYVMGFWRGSLVISPSLLQGLDEKDLRCLLAHELCHLNLGDTLRSWGLFALRAAMFFNPAVLLISRLIANEAETMRDVTAAQLLGDFEGYADSLLRTCHKMSSWAGSRRPEVGTLRGIFRRLGDHSLEALVRRRVSRLEGNEPMEPVAWKWPKLLLTLGGLSVLLFFVV